MGRRRPAVCFVDDDPAELTRFDEVFGDSFEVVTGLTYTDALSKLRDRRRRHPDLWVVDLYFPVGGRTNSTEELHEMSARFDEFDRARQEFMTYLCSIGQGREGGLEILARCRRDHHSPVVMFTRKGTIDDALASLSAGASGVLRKPMPRSLPKDKKGRAEALDYALLQSKPDLVDRFHTLIKQNTHWIRYRTRYLTVATFILGILIDRALEWIGL